MDEERVYCAGCGASAQVVWCFAFTAFLCAECKRVRTDRELKPTGFVAWATWELPAS